ncbi:MAG: arginase family protein, partial [candidate division WOR-3 bacterium]
MAFYYATASITDARLVLVGMPLDRTSSFSPGTRFGPDFARIGADNIESFSPYQRRDVSDLPIFDCGNLPFTYETPVAPF